MNRACERSVSGEISARRYNRCSLLRSRSTPAHLSAPAHTISARPAPISLLISDAARGRRGQRQCPGIRESRCEYTKRCSTALAVPCWGSAPPPNRGKVPKLWLGPKFSRTIDTLWSIDSQKKILNLMPPDVRF